MATSRRKNSVEVAMHFKESTFFEDHLRSRIKNLFWDPTLKKHALYLLEGGKSLRPWILIHCYKQLRGERSLPPAFVLDASLAVEMIHAYSLAHDDLPSMDNDSFRRGKPTVHHLENEALGILVGDALLTGAFEVLSTMNLDPVKSIKLLRLLSRNAGGSGLVAGQVEDLSKEKRDLKSVHEKKTGALFSYAVEAAALLADKENLQEFSRWGLRLGLLYQMVDDYCDEDGFFAEKNKESMSQLLALGQSLNVESQRLGFDSESITQLFVRYLEIKN